MKSTFLILSLLSFCLSFDFTFEDDRIFEIQEDGIKQNSNNIEISMQNAVLYSLNKTISSKVGKLIMDSNLSYYYHTLQLSANMRANNLLKLNRDGDKLVAKNAFSSYKNCFIIARKVDDKIMMTQNRSMLISINDLEAKENNEEFYLFCVAPNIYIY